MRLVSLLLLAAVACGSADASDPNATAALSIQTHDGTVSLDVQVADTPDERQIGLMGRESLSPYDGMAFVWGEPVVSSFWMKDTLIPLSIAFVDASRHVVTIHEMTPCTIDPCDTYEASAPYVMAVEANAGWFGEHGIEVGDGAVFREAGCA